MNVFECGIILIIVISMIISNTLIVSKMDEEFEDIYKAINHVLGSLDELEKRVDELDAIIQVMEKR